MKRGLIVGRFQPFHLGHLNALKNALKTVDEMIIVIGSPEESFTQKNPFTLGERIEMITFTLRKENLINKCFIIPVQNIHENTLWVKRVQNSCPFFDIVFTNNILVKGLFEREDYFVRELVSGKGNIESKDIRKKLVVRESIYELVPNSIEEYLIGMDAEKRLVMLYKEEMKK